MSVALAAHNPGRRIDHVCVVVMAGGLGTRLGDLTKDRPKPLLEVGGEPILQRIVRRFREEGFRNFIFCVNYKAGMIRDHFGDGSGLGVDIDYVTETQRMGTGGALSLIDRRDYSRFVVTNADILCSDSYREMLEFHEEQGAVATMAVREHVVEIPFGVVETNGFEIRSLREKPRFTHFINAGYYVLEAAALDHVTPDTFFDMPSLFDVLRHNDERTRIWPTRGEWIDIGRPGDLDRARQAVQQKD
jgi:NDP-sugar pyrophosphorylase family protein